MQRLKIILGIVIGVVVLQGLALLLLGLIVYQATPKSILGRDTIIGSFPGALSFVRVLDRSLNLFYWGSSAPEKLPAYQLAVDPKDWQEMEQSLPTELPSPFYGNLFLTDDNKKWIDGVFEADGETYDVKLKVRGDLFNHWANRKKSLRIRIADKKLFHGMSEFNLIIPEDRGWFALPLSAYRAEKLGLVHPPVRFVTLSLNGSDKMVYSEVEQWSPEMLERAGKDGNTNVYQTGGGKSYYQQWDAVFADAAYWGKYVTATGSLNSYEQIEPVLALGKSGAHNDPNFLQKIDAFFDRTSLINWYALGLLSGSPHVRDHNIRFYFDTEKNRLEPIPWDIGLYAPRTSILGLPGNPFLNEVFAHPTMRLAAHRLVWNYINDKEKTEDDLAMAINFRRQVERAAYRDSVKLQSNRQVRNELDRLSSYVQANFDFLRSELSRSEILSDQILSSTPGVLMTFELTSRGPVASQLAALSLPSGLAQGARLLKDTGNGIPDAGDVALGLTVSQDLATKGNSILSISNKDAALLWPGEAEIGVGEEVLNAPHTKHRFFLMGSGSIPNNSLPVGLTITNAVTGAPSQMIGEVVIDQR